MYFDFCLYDSRLGTLQAVILLGVLPVLLMLGLEFHCQCYICCPIYVFVVALSQPGQV
jgi:hypothetical protein